MLKTVGRYFDPWEAYILQGRLEAEGIPASVANAQHILANWPLSVALGGAVLQVAGADLQRAEAIIAEYYAGVFENGLLAENPDAADTCPACGSADISGSVPHRQRALTVATFLLASAPFPTRASRMECATCGNHWRYGG